MILQGSGCNWCTAVLYCCTGWGAAECGTGWCQLSSMLLLLQCLLCTPALLLTWASAAGPYLLQDKAGILLVVSASKDGALTGGDAFMQVCGLAGLCWPCAHAAGAVACPVLASLLLLLGVSCPGGTRWVPPTPAAPPPLPRRAGDWRRPD